VRDELEVARELQRQLLPRVAPALAGWEVAHSYRTANAVGGDYYTFRELPDGRVAVVGGDASGHGIAAGLIMVIAHSTLRLATDQDPRPEAVVPLVNKAIASAGGRRAFFTMFYGLLEPASGRLDFVCAGHPFPLLRHADGEVVELGRGGLPLGIRRQLDLAPETVTLAPGDLLLIYSDGIPESVRRSSGETFGFERLRHLVALGGSAGEAHDRVVGAFDAFLSGEPQSDDISLVALSRAGAPTDSRADPPPPPPPPPSAG
jgi:serine phosphatase RsbU (regulator of sigma subunit)